MSDFTPRDASCFPNLASVVETERAWAAGFYDGEGSCGAYPEKTRIALRIALPQTETSTLKRFSDAVGGLGSLVERVSEGRKHPHWSRSWCLLVSASSGIDQVVASLWPYLSGPKRAQIEAAYEKRAAYRATWGADLSRPDAKLTDQQVDEIRALALAGNLSQQKIADHFGISQTTVSQIKRGIRQGSVKRERSTGARPHDWGALPSPNDIAPPDAVVDQLTIARGGEEERELAWAAGFFDAEGCFRINQGKYLQMVVTQTEMSTLERFQSAVGGARIYRRSANQPAHWKRGWNLMIAAQDDLVRAVGGLWPYLSYPKRLQISDAWAARVAYRSSWRADFAKPGQRLSSADVRAIRGLLNEGSLTQSEIGRRFGVTNWHVSKIKHGLRGNIAD